MLSTVNLQIKSVCSVPPLFLHKKIRLHKMICHPPRLHPERRPDTLLHKAAMSLESSAPSYGRHISPPLPPVPMQTIKSFVSPLSIPLFPYQTQDDGQKAKPAGNSHKAGGHNRKACSHSCVFLSFWEQTHQR